MNTAHTYKQTAIGLIPKEWEVNIIENLGQVKRGAGSQYLTYLENDGIRFIRINDFFENNPVYVEATKDILRFCIEDNDILFAGTGASAGASYIPKKEWLGLPHSYNAPRIRVNPNQNRQFILYSLQSDYIAKQQKELFVGAAQPFLDTTAIANFIIAIPPIPEQQKIATILSTWDAAIDKCKTIIDNLKQRNKGLAQQLLTGKIRMKGFEKTKWIRVNADEVFVSHSQKNNTENEVLLSATQDRGMIPRDMLEGRVTMPTGETNSYKLVDKGDFVISLRSFQGGLEYSEYRGLVSPAYTVLKPIKPINDIFYKFYFKSYNFIGHLSVAVIGIRDGKNISYENFATIIIPNPSIEEQNAIEKILSKAEAELAQYQQKLQTLQHQKKGLMQQLLTGKTRVRI